MDVGRRDGVSKTVSFSDFMHIHTSQTGTQRSQVDAEITLTRRRRLLAY